MATIRLRGLKWQVQVRRAGSRPISKSFHLRKDACAWARQIEAQADRVGLSADPRQLKSITLGDLIRRYQREITSHKRGARVENAVLSKMLTDSMCSQPLSEVSSATFARYRDHRLKTITPGTLKRQLNPVRNMFEVARTQWGLPIAENPIAKLGFKGKDRRRDRRLTPGEFSRLIKAAAAYRNPIVKHIILFALATGMRRGEILRMEWKHLDSARRLLKIPVAKNGYSRTIPLSRDALRALPKQKPSGPCIFSFRGDALHLAFDRITRRAKIPDLRFHDLRHEAISRFFEAGLTVPEVAAISGHRDLTMLFRYAHAQNQSIFGKLDAKSQSSRTPQRLRTPTLAEISFAHQRSGICSRAPDVASNHRP